MLNLKESTKHPMNFKDFWKLYFTFNRSERRAIRFLLILITLIILVNAFMPLLIQTKQWDHSPYQAMLDSMSQAVSYKDSLFNSNHYEQNYQVSEGFEKSFSRSQNQLKPFNPNNLDEAGWQQLGLSEKQAAAVVNIRRRKGGFTNVHDLKQVKFIPAYVMQKIEPYLVIPSDTIQVVKPETKNNPYKSVKLLDINQANVDEWKELQGIGEKLAERIIRFREKLGGFYRVSQVCEVYGMPVETCDKIIPHLTVGQNDVTKIQLNYASTQELANHPYINYKLASAIVSNRNTRGFYKNVEEILTFGLVEKELYDKLAPYLTVQ
ncbi:MAG: helix-hairpin-helix domain-containing protein [Flavobacteriales bacterium]|nr:helix-hairpin-helix domain-containing protein [Flavobacteriales bacterium]